MIPHLSHWWLQTATTPIGHLFGCIANGSLQSVSRDGCCRHVVQHKPSRSKPSWGPQYRQNLSAIDRMLGHESGMIGFPCVAGAGELDRVVALKGGGAVP